MFSIVKCTVLANRRFQIYYLYMIIKKEKAIFAFSALKIISVFLFFSLTASAFAKSNRTTVYNISAEADSEKSIEVSWEFQKEKEKDAENFILYRANKPFSTSWELSEDSRLAEISIEKRIYKDEVKDYHEYYYALIVKTSDGEDRILLPSINATVNGVHRKIPKIKKQTIAKAAEKEKIYSEGKAREFPLPAIDMLAEKKENLYELNPQSIIAGVSLSGEKPEEDNKNILEPFAFEEDLLSPESGEDYLLFDTLHRTFAKRKYYDGTKELQEFLSVNHSDSVTNRAYFYLGECQYFSGYFREAIMSFLKIQDIYPDLCQKWIDSSLDLIDISDITY